MTSRSDTSISQPPDLPATLAASIQIYCGDHEALITELSGRMNRSWQEGRRVSADELLASYPALRRQREAVLRLVCEEFCLRRENGLTLSPDEWRRTFPEWRQEIDALFECQKLIEPEIAAPPSKLLGKLHDFELLSELGQGGQGQVYLASQPLLADRPVVVKVTPCRGREHLTLARLQHTHIVPLLSAQEFPDENQRILCMPYFGSVTLAHLLAKLQPIPYAQRTGLHILEVLDQLPSAVAPIAAVRGPARQLLSRASYAQAIVWMGACLADALEYAHERELLHLDIKPSNVLWTMDGQPMLLDFHLAHSPIHAHGPRPHGLGGTPMWMAPELESALNAVFQRQPVPCGVDARADVFALGLLLYHALGGTVPIQLTRPPRLEAINSQVSPGLADLVHRCLAPDPADRYQDAESLGADLRRHLNDLPLRGVSNRLRERLQKWRRRKPQAVVSWLLLAILLMVVAAAGGWSLLQQWAHDSREQEQRRAATVRIQKAEDALAQAQGYLREEKYQLALVTLENAKVLLPSASDSPSLHGAFLEHERLARRQHARQALHEGVNVLRAAVVAERLGERQIAQLKGKCRDLWEKREWIVPVKGKLDERASQDMVDLTVIWSELVLRLTSSADLPDTRRRLIAVLDEAEARCGGSPLLDYLRGQHWRALGDDAVARRHDVMLDGMTRLAAWEHVARARQLLQNSDRAVSSSAQIARLGAAGNPAMAVATVWTSTEAFRLELAAWHVDRALAMAPDKYWAHFYQGIAAYRMRRYPDAMVAFRVCIALEPRQTAGYHNRALAAAAAGEYGQALADYTRALELDPQFAPSALNRALVHVQLCDFNAAISDLHLARRNGADDKLVQTNLDIVHRLRGQGSIR